MTIARRRILLAVPAVAAVSAVSVHQHAHAAAEEGAFLRLALRQADGELVAEPRVWVKFTEPAAVAINGWRIDLAVLDRGDRAEVAFAVTNPQLGLTENRSGSALVVPWGQEARLAVLAGRERSVTLDVQLQRASRPA